jgi:hypothetical protein
MMMTMPITMLNDDADDDIAATAADDNDFDDGILCRHSLPTVRRPWAELALGRTHRPISGISFDINHNKGTRMNSHSRCI